MTSPKTVLQRDDATDGGDLYLSFELGDQRWTLTLSDTQGFTAWRDQPSRPQGPARLSRSGTTTT